MSDIALVCLTRDPKARLELPIKKLDKISEIYEDRVVFTSRDTAPKIKKVLTESGWTVTNQTRARVR